MNLFFTPHDQGGSRGGSHAEAFCARFPLVCWTCRSDRLFVALLAAPAARPEPATPPGCDRSWQTQRRM